MLEIFYHPFIKAIVLVSAFLLGLGDSSFITQIYPSINHIFPSQISCAVALFKFIQSLASTAAFVYSQYLLLQWQLIILATVATLGCTLFFLVERINHFHVLREFTQIQSKS
ncbi:hypothetical protein HELRODRAFT_189441 [Helobdella robusta]|uniref:Major facilitator superfamily (MFS) profile domain-containing protein n=1 Tax=Helobdella robusta TaxID=6412 RepID=T1FR22_HELRO|nr:hypothetical protein HELRODRAFT_189441 [Helobdella robusta]ESN94578.1 hypothetical protein HELRODRAFT_189441 [Helobdella robusta]